MPPRSRGHGHREGGDDPSQPRRGAHPVARSVRAAQDALGELSRAGRAGNAGGRGRTPENTQTEPLITQGTGRPGGTPTGHPTRPKPDDDASVHRSIQRENEGATILADHGYHIQQNPTRDEVAQARQATGDTGNPKSKPDYLVEGRVFDCYSPGDTKPVRGVHWEVENKVVNKRQTQRMVVNLADWPGDTAALRMQFRDWPIPGLKELKAITPDGDIVQIDLPTANTRE